MTTARFALMNILAGLVFAFAIILFDWLADRGAVPGLEAGHNVAAWAAVVFVLIQGGVNAWLAPRLLAREPEA